MAHQFIKCPECPAMVRSERLDKHIAKVHSEVKRPVHLTTKTASVIETKKNQRPKKPLRKEPRVRLSTLEAVYQNATGQWRERDTSKHGGVSAPPGSANATPLEKLRQQFSASETTCPHCGAKVMKGYLKIHKKKSCKVLLRQKSYCRKPRRSKGTGNQEVQRVKKQARGSGNVTEHDGSKGLGLMRREFNGQYGSYPMHDDYSEESNAD